MLVPEIIKILKNLRVLEPDFQTKQNNNSFQAIQNHLFITTFLLIDLQKNKYPIPTMPANP
jgi:hypothetical protein